MFNRSNQKQQAKAKRHLIGQQKCKIYQRSNSSKYRNPTNAPIQPSTGQFVVGESKQLKITSNIEKIVKDRHPSSASQVLSLNASRRNSLSNLHQDTNKLRLQEPMQINNVNKEKKAQKNSYLVKSRTQMPKYTQGYRIVKLEPSNKLKISNTAVKQQSIQEDKQREEVIKEETQFLPVQYYLLDDESPTKLMEKYQIKQTSYVLGYSRWYDLNGNSHWKKCRVLGFNPNIQRWNIEWLHNNRKKQVSRINLYFQGESKSNFERRVVLAHKYRKLSEIYFKYNNQIDEIKDQTHELNPSTIGNIIKKIKQNNPPVNQISKLLQEVKIIYIRSNHQAQFNACLPFDVNKRHQYEQYLPKYLFKPNQQHKMRYTISNTPTFSNDSITYFKKSKASFKDKTSLNSSQRLLILQYLNELSERMENECFVFWRQDKIYSLQEVIPSSKDKIKDVIRILNRAVCDIQHYIGYELDKLYVEKKAKSDIFDNTIQKYNGFLSMVTLRLQFILKRILSNTFDRLSQTFQSKDSSLTVSLSLKKKEDKIFLQISARQIKYKIQRFIALIMQKIQMIPCPSKSYLKQMRADNMMLVIDNPIDYRTKLFQILNDKCEQLNQIPLFFSSIADELVNITNQIKKQVQKRYSLNEMYILNAQIKDLEKKYKLFLSKAQDGKIRVSIFIVKIDEVNNRINKTFNEMKRDLYRIVLDRILKENQKIDRYLTTLQERLDKTPTNIIEMLALQKLVREEASEQLQKIYSKIRQIPNKMTILESIDSVEYKDYEACNKIYIFPLKLKQDVIRVRRDLQNTYRKKFGQELNKDAVRVLQTSKQCNEDFISCLKLQSLQDMCEKFMLFSNLNEKITTGIKEAELINERQQAMTCTQTDFTKLFKLSEEFAPYYSLISYAKVYQIQLQLLSNGPFNRIDYLQLQAQIKQTIIQIIKIREIFSKHPKMSRITCEIQDKYNSYAENLPIIKFLRNTDLRQRHWSTIRQILTVDPLDEGVSLTMLINLGAKLHVDQLQEISSIASRQLLYQKKLIKLKRDWKQIKFVISSQNEVLKTILNLNDLRLRVQSDIYQVQQILSASFIKFLESQIICWRNQVLYKAYELLEKWEKVQNQVCLVTAIFNKPKAKSQLYGEYIRFQILQKVWRSLCSQVQSQPWLSDILQGKAYDSLTSLQSSFQRIKKNLFSFFQDKKRQYARLGCISDDQFMNLLSCDQADPRENAVFQQTVRKCFQNIRTLIRNQKHQIVKIRTKSNEQIPFTELTYVQKLVEYILPNELIMQLQKKIQRELKSSLESIVQHPTNHITQVLLLYQRLNFTLGIEQQLIKNHCISASLLREIQVIKNELVTMVLDSSPNPKIQCELLQALYHLQITSSLWHQSSVDINSFSWLSQPRIYLRSEQYYVSVGLLTEQYGFQIVDLDNIITEEWSARIFCNYAGVIREKGFCLVEAGCSVGKTSSIRKLAALFGHKQFILDSSPLVSPRNLLEYIRMGASGMWVVLRNVQRLTREQFSLLSRNLQVCWYQNINSSKSFNIEGAGIAFKSPSLKIFTTLDHKIQIKEQAELCDKLKKYYRTVYLPRINIEYIVEVRLLLLGLQSVVPAKICSIITFLQQKLSQHSKYGLLFSEIYLINKFFSIVSKMPKDGETMINQAFFIMINDLVRDQKTREMHFKDVTESFKIRPINNQTSMHQQEKNKFINAKLYYNQNLLQVYHNLSNSLLTHNFIILLGPNNSGKSNLLSMIVQQNALDLTILCPNAYSIQDLYGNDLCNGVLCSIIEDTLKKIKKQSIGIRKKSILLDGQIDLWMQPLAGIISSGHIIQPNGNTLLIQQQLKFMFQCKHLNNAPPTLILYSSILCLQEPIKWQNLFTHYLATKFNAKYKSPSLTKFIQIFIPYIVDPIIEFYQSTCNQYMTNKSHCYIPSNLVIMSMLNLFEDLFHYHFLQTKFEPLNQKLCSGCFNLFVMAVVWTVGGVLPEQSRKSFTRHFKYLIKRAVQVNIQGVNKQSLPDDQQDLFKIYFAKDHWVNWSIQMIHSYKQVQNNVLFVSKPEDIGLSFIIQRYLQRSHSVYLLGLPSSQKVAFLQSVVSRMNAQVFNIRRLNFNPNSKASALKNLILKEMSRQKYSWDFKGFVHGKKTLISIRDVNLPLIKEENSFKVGVLQFIRHYYVTNGWYLKDNSQHYSFKGLVFCGSINIKYPIPTNLQKYSNLVFRSSHKQDLASVVTLMFQNSSLSLYSSSLVPLITNLHYTVCRQLLSLSLVGIEKSDALSITRSLIKMSSSFSIQKNQLLRRWMFLSEKIYQQKLISQQSQRLFYLINNTLMEQEKIRYKSIRPNPSFYQSYFAINLPVYYNIKTLRQQIQQKCNSIIDIEGNSADRKISKRKESKIQEFASAQLKYKINQLNNHISQVKHHMSGGLKDNFIKIIAHIINTFQLQTPLILSLSVQNSASFSALDLQQSLEIVAVIRQAKLVKIKLGESENWDNTNKGSWKDIVLGVIEQILSSIERGQFLKEIIILLQDFTSENDYIIDDIMDIKRQNTLPFRYEVTALLEYFLDNFKQANQFKSKEYHEEFYGIQSKAKLKQKKYQIQKRQRQKNLQYLQEKIIKKLKFVINISVQNIEKAKNNKLLSQYSDSLRQFSILNLNIFSQSNKSQKWKQPIPPSSVQQLKSKTIITDFSKDQEEISDIISSSTIDIDIILDENQQAILEHIIQKMTYKNCFSPQESWLRGKDNNLKLLYQSIKNRLKKLCHQKIQLLTKRIQRIINLQSLLKMVSKKVVTIEKNFSLLQKQSELIKKQKQQREMQYEQVINQNRQTQKALSEFKQQREQLQIIHQNLVSQSRAFFCKERDNLIQTIKQGKQTKIISMNNLSRIYLQNLGVLIQKKIKKDEELYKTILKDIYEPISNAKIAKKLSAISSSGPYNISQKISIRIRESIIQLQKIKQQRKIKTQQNEKQQSYFTRLTRCLSSFFSSLIEFFQIYQQKDVKDCLRRISENQRASEKVKDIQSRGLKSKEYLLILEKYQEIQKRQIQFQSKKNKLKSLKKICEFLKEKMMFLENSKHPQVKKSKICKSSSDHSQCTVLCWLKETLLYEKQCIIGLQQDIRSYSLSIALKIYYISENCQNDIVQIMNQFEKHRASQRDYNTIQYAPENLAFLTALSPLIKSHNSTKINQKFDQIKQKERILEKYLKSGNIMSLLQYSPGIIVVGVEKGSLDLGKGEISTIKFENNSIKQLYEDFIINKSQLTRWLRSKNQHSFHKVCLSSRVVIDNKNFLKSGKSIIIQDEIEQDSKNMCIVLVENRQQVKSLLKLIKRQSTNSQLTVVLITQNENVNYEENIYSIKLKNQDSKEFSKEVQGILSSFEEKSQSSFNNESNQLSHKQSYLRVLVNQNLDDLNQNALQMIKNTLQEQNQQITSFIHAIQSKENHKENAIKKISSWILLLSKNLQNSYGLLKQEQNLKKIGSEKIKTVNLNEISTYIFKIFELIIALQRNHKIPKLMSNHRFKQIIEQILEGNKEMSKKGISSAKSMVQIKMYLWNRIGSLYSQHFLFILIIFIFAEKDVPNTNEQLSHLILLCLQNYQEGIRELNIIRSIKDYQNKGDQRINLNGEQSENNLIKLYIRRKAQTSSQSLDSEIDNSPITDRMKRKLKKLETIMKSQQITTSFQNNSQEWAEFITTKLNQNANSIPNFLLSESNTLLVFYIISIFKPNLCLQWLKNNDLSGYHKQIQRGSPISSLKKGNIKIYQTSYYSQWTPLSNLLFYEFNALNTQSILLINTNLIDLIETCVSNKLNYAYYDFTTVFWEMQRANELNLQENQQAKLNDLSNQAKKQSVYISKHKEWVEILKANLKNQTWIIINLNYYKILRYTFHEYFTKIHEIISSLRRCISEQCKGQKNTRSMVIFLANFETEKQTPRQKQCKSSQETVNTFLHLPKSFIYLNHNYWKNQITEIYQKVKQLRRQYYFCLFRCAKSKRQYERLPLSQKYLIFSFISISQNIINDYLIMNTSSSSQNILMDYVEQLISRIYGCISIIKTFCLTEQEEQLLSAKQGQKCQYILFKIQQYTLLLIEYTFQLNYKTSLIGKRIHCTLQYVSQIKKSFRNAKASSLEAIITQLSTQQQEMFQSPKQIHTQKQGLMQNIINFHSQGLVLDIQQKQKEVPFRQQQQKLLQIFVQQSRLSFHDKIKEISAFQHEQFSELKNLIQRLKLFDTKQLYNQYRQLQQSIYNSVQNLQPKYAKLSCKLKQKSSFTTSQNASTIITNALADLFNKQTFSGEQIDDRSQVNDLEEILLKLIINLKKQIASVSTFLESVRDIVKAYIQIEFHSTVRMDIVMPSDASEDDQQNQRNNQEQEIKSIIKKKIQTKVLVQKLIKKIGVLQKQLQGEGKISEKHLVFKEQNRIYDSIELVQQRIKDLQVDVKDSISNHLAFRKIFKEKILKLQDIHSQLRVNEFTFSFGHHSLIQIINIMKIMHAKKHHQQFHQLTYKLKLASHKGKSKANKTIFYFRNFRLVNAKYTLNGDKFILTASYGNIVNCFDLLIQVMIEQQGEINSSDDEQNGYIEYGCPFYVREGEGGVENRQRVHLVIKQIELFQIIKHNIYMIS